MSAESAAIATPLNWLKGEIDRSLGLARAALARTPQAPAQRPACLSACVQPISHIRGALQMLNLEGSARFCGALEQAVQGFVADPARLNELTTSVLDRALFALSQFLDDLAKGEPDVPLKLFPMYRELIELTGRRDVSEIDLFFPDVSAAPARPCYPAHLDAERRERHVSAARAHYQRGLVAWLKQPHDSHALQAMRAALDALDRIADQIDAPAGTWWVATGLVDLLLHNDAPDERAALKPILARLDRLMRAVAGGGEHDAAGVMRDMLYRIAAAPPICPRVCDIKSLYRLDVQLPEFCVSGTLEYDVSALAPVLERMRQKLLAMEEAWARYAAGSSEDLQRLRSHATALKTIARDLGHYRLVRLLDIVGLIALKLPDAYPAPNEVLALEMAAALLFMESMLEHFTSPPPDIDQQVAVMVGWLLDALKPGSAAALGAGAPRDDITQRQHYAQVRAQVAREILANLNGVERTVDEIARAPDLRARIATLDAPMRQIAGALKMLGLSRANGVVSACVHLMRLSASADTALMRAALEWVADGLSCLGFYLDNVCQDETPNEEILLGFVRRLSRDDAHPAGSIGWIPAADAAEAYTPAAGADVPRDTHCEVPDPASIPEPDAHELRSVYLGEALEILAQMPAPLSALRVRCDDRAALTEIRRAFHTLKGGARLVHLDHIGELAWHVEQTLNAFLGTQSFAGDDLPVLIDEAAEALGATVRALEQGIEPDLSAYDGIAALAIALREPAELVPDEIEDCGARPPAAGCEPSGAIPIENEHLAEPGAPASTAACELPAFDPDIAGTPPSATCEPAGDEIAIGRVRFSRALYEIYLGESEALLATLHAEIARWADAPAASVPDVLIRAAHTLRSTASALGFDAVAALSSELEEGLLRLGEAACTQDHRDALDAALSALTVMFADIRNHLTPTHDAVAQAKLSLLGADTACPSVLVQPREITCLDCGEMRERLDPRMAAVFLEEAVELLPLMRSELSAWRRHRAAVEPARGLARALHTLKGGARTAGATRVGELIHALESQVCVAIDAPPPDDGAFDALATGLERLARSIRNLGLAPAAAHTQAVTADRALPGETAHARDRQHASDLSIDAESADRLVDQAGEIGSARLRVGNELEALRGSLHDLTDSVARLRSLLRETQLEADSQVRSRSRPPASGETELDPPGFDPLELDRYTRLQDLTRMMAESLHDVQMIQQSLLAASAETEAALALQGRVVRDLQQRLIGLRSLPFGTLNERLQRTVRQSAEALGRAAELHIEGEGVELDRTLLQRLAAPLEHLLRNALAHGIEPAPVRAALGKPSTGRIDLEVQRQGFQLVLTLADDGAGLDAGSIRHAAQGLGLLSPTDEAPAAALGELIFAPGLSTATELTESSGRGIGLDAARTEVIALGGSIEVTSAPGAGAAFCVRLPLALATAEVLLVRAADILYAIPSELVETVEELAAADLSQAYALGMIGSGEDAYPLYCLRGLLGKEGAATATGRRSAVLLLRSGEHRMALHVDAVVRNQEAMLKPLGAQLARVPGLYGTIVVGNGPLVLVIDPLRWAVSVHPAHIHGARAVTHEAAIAIERAHVMVVDDSLTVRRLSGRLLSRAGFEISTAKDGLDALQQIRCAPPDLVVLDLEMPRMDGFELVRELRADLRTAAVPIVVVSSRLAQKHQRRATEMGADAFFGKPYPEDELLACIAGLLRRRSAPQAA